MPTMDEARPSADELQQRLDFETLFSDLSSRFIQLPAGEVDREIEDALRRLCGASSALPRQERPKAAVGRGAGEVGSTIRRDAR